MKKLVIVLIALFAINTQAQKQKMNLTPEQSATLRVKEMTLQLELTDKQQKTVFKLCEQQAVKRVAMRKVSKEDLTDEQRYEMKLNRLDSQIAHQNEMKEILNEKQFEQWKEMRNAKQKSMKKAIRNKKSGEQKREHRK